MSFSQMTISQYVKPLLIAIASTLLSSTAFAEVTLLVDDNIKVTAINGQTVNTSPFQAIITTFTLEPGMQVITAKYDRLYDLRGDNFDYLHSDNVSVSAQMQDNQTYRLSMPGQPEAYEDARKYAKHPNLAVVLDGQIVAEETSVANDSGGLFSNVTQALGGVFGAGDDSKATNQKAIAALDRPTASPSNPVATPTVGAKTTQSIVPTQQASTLDSFMQLWLNATPEERSKIRQWVDE